ncbi:hypothetical protein GQ53DRAFT_887434 [Thozetella sp. PMI_491]|nr:hypothetical protein GQ53DRAFT_887434 [Thozetella sp. PMI_491]
MLLSLASLLFLASSAHAAGKRGLGWPSSNTDPVSLFTTTGSKVTWLYNWGRVPTPNSTLEFVPMQWDEAAISTFAAQTKNATHMLGFNEPERSDQANLPAAQAAADWVKYIEPLRKAGVRCGSPGISAGSTGINWLISFLAAIRAQGSDVDFYALHWYGEGLGGFYDYLWSSYYQLGADKTVWITEYATSNFNEANPLSQAVVEDFAKQSIAYLDSLDWIERYAWFGAMPDVGGVGKWAALMDGKGGLTNLGKIYRDT